MEIRNLILEALEKKYEANIAAAEATLKVYLDKPVGIGEHPQIVDEADKLIATINENEDKLKVVKKL